MVDSALSARIKKLTIIATLILLILIAIIVVEYIRLGNLRAEAKRLEETRAQYEQQIEDLEQGNKERATRSFVEQYARDEMGLIKEGETRYIFK